MCELYCLFRLAFSSIRPLILGIGLICFHYFLNVTAAQEIASVFEAEEPKEEGEFETDRDSFTFATSIMGIRRTAIEASYSFIDNRIGPDSHSFPELLARRGVNDWLELRLGWNYEAGGPGAVSGSELGGGDLQVETEGRLLYGAKFLTSTQTGWKPQSTLIVQGFTPTAGPTTTSTFQLGEAFGWTLANGWKWDSSFRFATAYDHTEAFVEWAPSTVLKIPVGGRWTVHGEYFGIMSSGKHVPIRQQFASFGVHYMPTPDWEVGIRCGIGLTADSPAFFNNVGIARRF